MDDEATSEAASSSGRRYAEPSRRCQSLPRQKVQLVRE
jgi:hypothetical protein